MNHGVGFEEFDECSGSTVGIGDFPDRAIVGDLVNAPLVNQQFTIDPVECAYAEIAFLFQLPDRQVTVKNACHERIDDRILVHEIVLRCRFGPFFG